MISTSETSCNSCCPPFRQPPTSYNACVYGWQRQASSFKSSNRLSPNRSRDFCSMSSDLNPIEHIWDMLGRCIQSREPLVQTIRQLEVALHREWQQLSQHDIRRLTGGMRRRFEAVIQARGGYILYWTLNNRCRQVIHKFRKWNDNLIVLFELWRSILKMDMLTAKSGLVILWLNIH